MFHRLKSRPNPGRIPVAAAAGAARLVRVAYGVRSTQAHSSSASEIAIIAIGTCALVHPSSVEDRRFKGSDLSTESVAMAGKFIGPGPEFPFGRYWPAATAGH